jgi:GNAT superfamily N-acetyltransferase
MVAVDAADQPIAFGNLEANGHIDHLYSSPEAVGTGAASAIYDSLESQAKKLGLTRLYVEASECALPFFEHKEFIRVRRNDFERRGVPIHNYTMEKFLPIMTSEADRIVGLYQRHGRAWAADRGNNLLEKAWLDRFLALLPTHPRALDIGCGSGEPIGRYLIENECDVTGVDSSPELITIAKEHFPTQKWQVADMRALCLDNFFNGLLAWDSFFHLSPEYQRKMFPIFKQHAAPRAALMFTSGTWHGVAMGTYRGEPLYHASLDPGEYRELLDTMASR